MKKDNKIAIVGDPIIEFDGRGANKTPQTILQYLMNTKKERGEYRNKSDRKRNRASRWS
ncbi:hypothetical protein NVP1149O_17 [Vibrio phage 1.149.O._10N.286.55.A12]|nr:hypothetical protein NVP1149O_17 [Vibrio phage 1.149.O._10N.286.55.A12]